MTNIVNYPENPVLGQEITIGATIKRWDGEKWVNKSFGNHELRLQALEVTVKSIKDLPTEVSFVGQKFVVVSYHAEGNIGGGSFVWSTGKHNGGTFIDPTREFPTDWNNPTQLSAWFAKGTTEVGGFKRIDYAYSSPIFGCRLDGQDETAALIAFAQNSDNEEVAFQTGATHVSDSVVFLKPRSIDFGKLHVEYDADDTKAPIVVGSEEITDLQTLSTTLNKFTRSITLPDATSIQIGDMLSVWNPADFSYSGFRANYRQGEYVFVEDIVGNEVFFDAPLVDTYPVNSKVSRLATIQCNITGSIEFTNVGTLVPCYGLQIVQNTHAVYDGLQCKLYNGTHSLVLRKNAMCTGNGMIAFQQANVASGLDYGLAQLACQDNAFSGWFHAERHGSTTGGGGTDAEAVNRRLKVRGRITTTGLGGVHAADCHGNTEDMLYGGYLGGCNMSGHNTLVEKGSLVVSPKASLPALAYSELKSTRHTASKCRLEMSGSIAPRGLIDAGGNSNAMTGDTTYGGDFDFSGCELHAPNAEAHLITIRNRGATVDFDILLDDIKLVDTTNISHVIRAGAVSGSDPKVIRFNNKIWQAGVSASLSTDLVGVWLTGEYNVTLDTDSNRMQTKVEFSDFGAVFPVARTPRVHVDEGAVVVGSALLLSEASNQDNTEFFGQLFTADRTNFSSALNITVRWKAEL